MKREWKKDSLLRRGKRKVKEKRKRDSLIKRGREIAGGGVEAREVEEER